MASDQPIIGLRRGTVRLADHDPRWETLAQEMIERLWCLFGSRARDIQHVGSTAIKSVKAKPIIDIAVAVDDFARVGETMPLLAKDGFSKSLLHDIDDDILIVDGDENSESRAYHIHLVIFGSTQWVNYLLFRDYLNQDAAAAKAYDALKIRLAAEHAEARNAYTDGKGDAIDSILKTARIWEHFGRSFTSMVSVDKGWSGDRKYHVTRKDGTEHLLRVSPAKRHDSRKALHQVMRQAYAMGIPMACPEDMGILPDGVYTMESWIRGSVLEDVLPTLLECQQYSLGIEAGHILRKIHEIPAPDTQEEWAQRFNRKIDAKIRQYGECGLRFPGDQLLLGYIQQNRNLLRARPQCLQHGDYHTGNMMLGEGKLRIIDFDRFDYGDPWEESNRIVWSAQVSPHFATGQVRGYFGGEPPADFWCLSTLYIATNTLSSLPWAIPFGEDEIATMMNQAHQVLVWHDDMENPVPTWYLKDLPLRP